MPEGPEPMDWQGAPLNCAACRFASLSRAGACRQGWACAFDRYAKRIERFFLLNPSRADECLGAAYFETRMNAARVASLFRLPRLLTDDDPGVRAMALLRLPSAHALRRIKDPDRRVRIAVAHRLPTAALLPMMEDGDDYVRSIVARRAEPGMLPVMIPDPDPEIRRIVARRIGALWLDRFRADPDPLVRREAARRRPALFIADEDLRVRHEAAENGAAEDAAALLNDPEALVAETARARLAQLEGEAAPDVHR